MPGNGRCIGHVFRKAKDMANLETMPCNKSVSARRVSPHSIPDAVFAVWTGIAVYSKMLPCSGLSINMTEKALYRVMDIVKTLDKM